MTRACADHKSPTHRSDRATRQPCDRSIPWHTCVLGLRDRFCCYPRSVTNRNGAPCARQEHQRASTRSAACTAAPAASIVRTRTQCLAGRTVRHRPPAPRCRRLRHTGAPLGPGATGHGHHPRLAACCPTPGPQGQAQPPWFIPALVRSNTTCSPAKSPMTLGRCQTDTPSSTKAVPGAFRAAPKGSSSSL